MARKVRLELAGAKYHVINRGNYRRDLFESVGAAAAFVTALGQAAERFRWKLYAYVLMRNHFHLAIETVQPTLSEGMQWLQSTMAVRFNRFRSEHGHLFQGRFKAMPIEDAAALARVVDYIHLNPVRARVVKPEWLPNYRWSSLRAFLKGPRLPALDAEPWLRQRGNWTDDPGGLGSYVNYLTGLASDEAAWERAGVLGLSKGWAIGTNGWRRALAKDYAHAALARGLSQSARRALRQDAWELALLEALRALGRSESDLVTRPKKQDWKLELARTLRRSSGASVSWLAERLHLGQPDTVRGYLHHLEREGTNKTRHDPFHGKARMRAEDTSSTVSWRTQ